MGTEPKHPRPGALPGQHAEAQQRGWNRGSAGELFGPSRNASTMHDECRTLGMLRAPSTSAPEPNALGVTFWGMVDPPAFLPTSKCM